MELISRASLMGKLTSAEMQRAFREMSGQDAYTTIVTMLNEEPRVAPGTTVNQYGENCSSITNTGILNISL